MVTSLGPIAIKFQTRQSANVQRETRMGHHAPGSNKVKIWQNLYVLHFDPALSPGAYDDSEV